MTAGSLHSNAFARGGHPADHGVPVECKCSPRRPLSPFESHDNEGLYKKMKRFNVE